MNEDDDNKRERYLKILLLTQKKNEARKYVKSFTYDGKDTVT